MHEIFGFFFQFSSLIDDLIVMKTISLSRALLLSVLIIWLVAGGAILAGLVVFANYWSCDPQLTGIITEKDELVTLFVLDHLVDFVGIPGIFIASLLCGALR